jgi:hypothetical protein
MNLINDSILLLINVLHLIVIIFIICTPFTDSNYLLLMHVIIIPFILIHWLLNNNTCSLTLAEQYIRNKTYGVYPKDDECFTYKFISPIYDFNKNYEAYSNFTYIITIGLWALSSYKLYDKVNTGKITNLSQLTLL